MAPQTFGHVPIQDGTTLHVLEAKFAEEQFGKPAKNSK